MFSKKATKIEGEDFIKFWGLLRKNMNFSKCRAYVYSGVEST